MAVSCGVGRRRGSDPTLLWLWRRPEATAPIRPLAWEPPYATGAAQKMAKKQKQTKKPSKKTQKNKKRKWGFPGHVASEWLDLSSFIVLLFPGHDHPSFMLEEGEIQQDLVLGRKSSTL